MSPLTSVPRGLAIIIGVLCFTVLCLTGTVVFFAFQDQADTNAKCLFYHTVATDPFSMNPIPTKRSVAIAVAARTAYEEAECGTLPQPDKGLIRAAQIYNITIRK